MEVEELPWERIVVDGKEHNHAFKKGSNGIRTVSMRLTKNGELTLTSGFKELQVLKTTQSGFEGYLRDEYTTLPGKNNTKYLKNLTFKFIRNQR